MSRPQLVCLYSPLPQMGKNSCALHLATQHGFQRVAFAEPIRAMLLPLLVAYGYSSEEAHALLTLDKEEPLDRLPGSPSSRHLMRMLGDLGRNLSPRFWVEPWRRRVLELLRAGSSVVADDLRFPAELKAATALGGTCLRLLRPGVSRADLHGSDGALEAAQLPTLSNSSTLLSLLLDLENLLGLLPPQALQAARRAFAGADTLLLR
jgi:hypothetical protein